MTAVVLFAHGSRDAEWARPFRAIRDRIRAARPELGVELAFLEVMQPTLADALTAFAARGESRIYVAPLFMAQGAHLKRDLAAMLEDGRRAHPHVAIEVLPAVGEMDSVLAAISDSIAKAAA